MNAQKIKTENLSGGIEWWLDLFCVFGCAGGIICGAAFAVTAFMRTNFSPGLLWDGLTIIFFGVVIGLLCKGMAEIIRLLKKANGLSYSGHISNPSGNPYFACSKCEALVGETENKCVHCGASFEN